MTAFVVAQFAAVAPVVVAGWLALSLTNSAAGSARTRRRCQAWTLAAGIAVLGGLVALSLAATSLILWRLLPPTGPGVAAVLLPFLGGFGVLAHRRHPVPTARGDARTATTV
jgi:hypothetical protein